MDGRIGAHCGEKVKESIGDSRSVKEREFCTSKSWLKSAASYLIFFTASLAFDIDTSSIPKVSIASKVLASVYSLGAPK